MAFDLNCLTCCCLCQGKSRFGKGNRGKVKFELSHRSGLENLGRVMQAPFPDGDTARRVAQLAGFDDNTGNCKGVDAAGLGGFSH